ncbi:hypothetical protein [Niveibacterium umoris]|uniref:WGR domain-containing protein n=1 Tax=Niveibacterium umoris TaxID=1193620 RepID=A0A840BI17_9RHOO|nr:hypothetical protein [Niveibacterium umoris]MBB4011278.1 hypothetical protein [Niveibacterium umoris]
MNAPQDPCTDAPFCWRATGDGRVFIEWGGRTVTVLAGVGAARFLARVKMADERAAQLLMARATGNFRRGNERRS